VTDTISVTITPDKTRGGQWTAWHAAMQLASPYTVYNPVISVIGQTQACPAQSWSFTVAGHPSSSG
jgi:hypothetical protein